MDTDRLRPVEDFVRPYMVPEAGHDFQHVERVRRWARTIAEQEGYARPDMAEAAALLHDIGLRDGGRPRHAEVGAELATTFLREHRLFDEAEIEAIATAIRSHSSLHPAGRLVEILQDADGLELFGAV